jgi:alpha-amylase
LNGKDSRLTNNRKYYFLKNQVGFAGWRYDQVRGYSGSHIGQYNDATNPKISVGEFWDNNAQKVVDWIDETGGKSMAFDFPTRNALVMATLNQDYSQLKTLGGNRRV